MKTILVPVDFSKNSLNAVEYAAAIAKKEKAKMILLHAYHFSPPTSDVPLPGDVVHSLRAEATKKLNALCVEITQIKKIKCEYLVKYDFAVNSILEMSKEKKADLIVMGTKGASGIKEIFLGSNTAKVIENTKIPVIAVPEKAAFSAIKKITYATDYHASDFAVLKKVALLAKSFRAKINVIHAANEELTPETEDMLLDRFKSKAKKKVPYPKISYGIRYGTHLEKILQEHVSKEKPDLIAMSTQRRNLLEKFFGTSATQKMAYHSSIPLLTFHHKQASAVFI